MRHDLNAHRASQSPRSTPIRTPTPPWKLINPKESAHLPPFTDPTHYPQYPHTVCPTEARQCIKLNRKRNQHDLPDREYRKQHCTNILVEQKGEIPWRGEGKKERRSPIGLPTRLLASLSYEDINQTLSWTRCSQLHTRKRNVIYNDARTAWGTVREGSL